MPGLRFALVVGLGVALATPSAAWARAESAEAEVERLAADALNAYKGADYHRAVELLTRAYEIRQVPALLYNLAKAEDKLGDVDRAADAYRRYVQSTGADPKLKARAEARLVVLDETRRKEAEAKASAAAAALPPVVVTAAQIASAPPPVTPEQLRQEARQAVERRRNRQRLFALGFGAATVAFAAVAVGLSVDALQLRDDYGATVDFARKRQLESDARTRAGVADGFYAATAAAAVVTAVFLYRGFRHERAPVAVTVAPAAAPSSVGLVASGHF